MTTNGLQNDNEGCCKVVIPAVVTIAGGGLIALFVLWLTGTFDDTSDTGGSSASNSQESHDDPGDTPYGRLLLTIMGDGGGFTDTFVTGTALEGSYYYKIAKYPGVTWSNFTCLEEIWFNISTGWMCVGPNHTLNKGCVPVPRSDYHVCPGVGVENKIGAWGKTLCIMPDFETHNATTFHECDYFLTTSGVPCIDVSGVVVENPGTSLCGESSAVVPIESFDYESANGVVDCCPIKYTLN